MNKGTNVTNRDTGKSRSLDDVQQVRLVALLRDMLDGEGWVKTAATLGVSYRTLVRAHESGRLTGLLVHALERHLLDREDSEVARQRKETAALRQDVEALEKSLVEMVKKSESRADEMDAVIRALRKELSGKVRNLQRHIERFNDTRVMGPPLQAPSAPIEDGALKPPWRLYPDLVTPEPEEGEELVYGDVAPLVIEWRRISKEVLSAKKGVAGIDTRIRWLRLEIELIDRHGMTLPPRTYPWDQFERKREFGVRARLLEGARAERNRAMLRRRVRRVLTLGLWRD